MKRAAALLAWVLLCACGESTVLPAPEILSISPNRVLVNERGTIVIAVEDLMLPVKVDYGRELVDTTSAVQVLIGPEAAALVRVEADGTLEASVPESLGKGEYEVRILLADGREAVSPTNLTITTPGQSGEIDTSDITGFDFETVGNQRSDQPFTITVRARGPRAKHFRQTVRLSAGKKASVSPASLGPFEDGQCTQQITLRGKSPGSVRLTVTDPSGAQGSSNGFKVD